MYDGDRNQHAGELAGQTGRFFRKVVTRLAQTVIVATEFGSPTVEPVYCV
jgi:hypothetical protein